MKSDCSVLLYAEELAQPAAQLQENLSHLVIKNVLSLEKLLETPEDNNHYPFDKSFDEVQNEPCLILHSSGSTGLSLPSLFIP